MGQAGQRIYEYYLLKKSLNVLERVYTIPSLKKPDTELFELMSKSHKRGKLDIKRLKREADAEEDMRDDLYCRKRVNGTKALFSKSTKNVKVREGIQTGNR